MARKAANPRKRQRVLREDSDQRLRARDRASTIPTRTRLLRLERESVPVPCVVRVRAKNYKSIEACDVDLGAISLLVGHNGAGKSNFVDILRFTSDSLKMSLEHAIRERGGIQEVRRRSRGHPTHFGIRIDLAIARGWRGSYGFQIAAKRGGAFAVQHEECFVTNQGTIEAYFTVSNGALRDSSEPLPSEVEPDRLMLSIASALAPFRRTYDVLANLGFYNLNLEEIRELQNPDQGELLRRDGSNLAAVVRRLRERQPKIANRIDQYLQAVVPGVRSVSARTIGPKETIEFRQVVSGDPNPWRYLAASVSDGTLRALGVLMAVFQTGTQTRHIGIPLVAIEEPEVAIHPGAAVKLMDALLEASQTRQLLVTTHSPDLLDHPSIRVEDVLVVEANAGNTVIAPLNEPMRAAVHDHLYTVGELLRLEQVVPDFAFAAERKAQMRLFGIDQV